MGAEHALCPSGTARGPGGKAPRQQVRKTLTMSVIVNDAGFCSDDWRGGFVELRDLVNRPWGVALGLDLHCAADPAPVVAHFPRIGLIRIRLPDFAARCGFELAQRIRSLGYRRRLRAWGNVLAHQYTLVRRAGFDEVEISAALALRQPEEHWRFLGNWRHDRFGSRTVS